MYQQLRNLVAANQQVEGLLDIVRERFPSLLAAPGIGQLEATSRGLAALRQGNGVGAAEAVSDLVPVGRIVNRAVRGLTGGRSTGEVGSVRNITTDADRRMALAQQRAALPVSEGGLGLPTDNTPMQRAQAMGFDLPGYHGTGKVFDVMQTNRRGVNFTTPDPEFAGKYAGGEYSIDVGDSPNIIPTLTRTGNAFDYESPDAVKRLAQRASLGSLATSQIKEGDWRRLEDRTLLDEIHLTNSAM
jgi:hypothetical protein